MVKLFNKVNQSRIEPTEFALTFKSIKDLFTRDKTNGKTVATNEIATIFWMWHPDSGYKKSHNEEERLGIITRVVFGENTTWKPDEKFHKASSDIHEYYVEHNALLRILESAETAYLKQIDFFDNIDMTSKDRSGKLIYDPKLFNAAVKELGSTYDKLEELRKKVIEDLQEDTRVLRGGAKLSKYNS